MARFFPVGEAITRGEQKVLDYLQHALPDNWVVFGNAQFTTSELPCDVDTIVVGDRCIWVVDAKGFGARLRGDEHTWILADGSAPERILNNVLHAAKMVRGRPALWEQAKRCRRTSRRSCRICTNITRCIGVRATSHSHMSVWPSHREQPIICRCPHYRGRRKRIKPKARGSQRPGQRPRFPLYKPEYL